MRVARLTALVLLAVAEFALAADQPPATRARAVQLREIRDQIDASAVPGVQLYERFFEAFPTSFAEVSELLVSDGYRDVLLRPGEKWDFGNAYVALMCRAYDFIGHRRYMHKLLRIGVEAQDWGGPGKDPEKYLYPGDIYQRLVFRYACEHRTAASHQEQASVIFELVPEFTDAEFEAIYQSLSWGEDSSQRVALNWLLDGICSRYPQRCKLTRALREKYVEHLYESPHLH